MGGFLYLLLFFFVHIFPSLAAVESRRNKRHKKVKAKETWHTYWQAILMAFQSFINREFKFVIPDRKNMAPLLENNWWIYLIFQHDPEQCTPGGEDGNFIMFARATSGDKRNNNKFSPCSLKAIEPVLNAKARSSKGCFTGKLFTNVLRTKMKFSLLLIGAP